MVDLQVFRRNTDGVSVAPLMQIGRRQVLIAIKCGDASVGCPIEMEFRIRQLTSLKQEAEKHVVRLAEEVVGTERREQVAHPWHVCRLVDLLIACQQSFVKPDFAS
jgi:hypothetical protein